MPLESITYIPDLVPANPVVSDGLNQGDDHIRGIKAALRNTFPNFTDAPLTSTQAAIEAAADAMTNGITVLADGGVTFKTNTTDQITNPLAGEVDIKAGGNVVAKFKSDKSVSVQGALSAVGSISGPGATPVGGMILWLTDALPDPAVWGTWVWANGSAISRSANAPLFTLWGTRYGAGDGSTTFNVIDMREYAPVGNATMGGLSQANRIAQYSGTAKSTLGTGYGEGAHSVAIAELPAHSHTATVTDPGHSHVHEFSIFSSGTGSVGTGASYAVGNKFTDSATTGISVSVANTGSGSAMNIVQPSMPVNYIVRAA